MSIKNFCDNMIRIKNAYKAFKDQVVLTNNNLTKLTLESMKLEGFIEDISEESFYLNVKLKYTNSIPAIKKIRLISKPSRKFYIGTDELKQSKKIKLNTMGYSVCFLSTNKGIMPTYKAYKENIGGLVLMECF